MSYSTESMGRDMQRSQERELLENAPSSASRMDVALVLTGHLRLLLLGPLLAAVAVYAATFALTPRYMATTVILPPQQQQGGAAAALQNLGALASLAGGTSLRSPVDQYVALMQSRTVQDRVIEKFDLRTVYGERLWADARKQLGKRTQVSASKKDGLVTVSVEDEDPARAAAMANGYVSELKRMTADLALTEAQQRRAFFEGQLKQSKDRFAAAQKALQSSGFNEGALRAEPRATAEGYARLRAEVTALEVRIQSMRVGLTDAAPEIRQAQEQLAVLRGQLARLESANSAASQGDYIDRYREFKYQEALTEMFAKQFEIAKVDESREGSLIQIVDAAVPPERKSWPKRLVPAIIALPLTGLLLLIFVVIRSQLSGNTDPGRRLQLRQNLRRAFFLSNRA